MSLSPPIRRYSSASSRQEELINAYEAEEERIINVLSRKLERLKEENIALENTLEAESESHVNRLTRELTALRLAQQSQSSTSSPYQNGVNGTGASSASGSVSASPETRMSLRSLYRPEEPSMQAMLETMQRENAQIRSRLAETEQAFARITRLNDVYREELIDLRRRLGIPIDNLIGLSSPDPLSQPTHRRRSPSMSGLSSPNTLHQSTSGASRPLHGVPIPRPPSQVHRIPPTNNSSEANTPLSHSPSSSDSPFPFSPITSTHPASYLSNTTSMTTPPTSVSVNSLHNNPMGFGAPARALSYPSVPPPSLSSSFGSPTVPFHIPHRDPSLSPVEPLSRRNSNVRRGSMDWRVAESGRLGGSRRGSVEWGARIAETGTLVPRSRAGSQSLSPTVEAVAERGNESSSSSSSPRTQVGNSSTNEEPKDDSIPSETGNSTR